MVTKCKYSFYPNNYLVVGKNADKNTDTNDMASIYRDKNINDKSL